MVRTLSSPRPAAVFAAALAGMLLAAVQIAADTAIVPDDFPTIQQAVDAVQGTPSPRVIIASDATFVEAVRVVASVSIRAADGFHPTIRQGEVGCTVASRCAFALNPAGTGLTRIELRGLRLLPPEGIAPGTGGAHVELVHEGAGTVEVLARELDLDDPEGTNATGFFAMSKSGTGPYQFVIEDSRIRVRGAAALGGGAVVGRNHGAFSIERCEISMDGPGEPLFDLVGLQSLSLVASTVDLAAPAAPAASFLGFLTGELNVAIERNRFVFHGEPPGSAQGFRIGGHDGESQVVRLVANRFVGGAELESFALALGPSAGASAELLAINNVLVGLSRGLDLEPDEGTPGAELLALVHHNTIHGSATHALGLYTPAQALLEIEYYNNLLTGSAGAAVDWTFSGGTLLIAEGFNGFFGNANGDHGPGMPPPTDGVFADPLYVGAGDVRLLEGSPMIDAGTDSAPFLPDDDIDGNPRPQGAGRDIGAYEGGVSAAIFADGFETGTTGEWSISVP